MRNLTRDGRALEARARRAAVLHPDHRRGRALRQHPALQARRERGGQDDLLALGPRRRADLAVRVAVRRPGRARVPVRGRDGHAPRATARAPCGHGDGRRGNVARRVEPALSGARRGGVLRCRRGGQGGSGAGCRATARAGDFDSAHQPSTHGARGRGFHGLCSRPGPLCGGVPRDCRGDGTGAVSGWSGGLWGGRCREARRLRAG